MHAAQLYDQASRLLQQLEEEAAHHGAVWASPSGLAADRAILDAAPAVQVAFVHLALAEIVRARHLPDTVPAMGAFLQRALGAVVDVVHGAPPQAAVHNLLSGFSSAERRSNPWLLRSLVGRLLRRRLPLGESDMVLMLDRLRSDWRGSGFDYQPALPILRTVVSYTDEHGLSSELRAAAEPLLSAMASTPHMYADDRKALALVESLLGLFPPATSPLDTDDDWGSAAQAALDDLDPAGRAPWLDILAHAAALTATKPSAAWQKQAAARIDAYGRDRFARHAAAWLALLRAPARHHLGAANGTTAPPAAIIQHNAAPLARGMHAPGDPIPSALIGERNAALLKGLVWCCSGCEDETLVRALGDAAEACFKKIPEIGARSVKVGNACIAVLGGLPGFEAVAQLQRLTQRVKQPSARTQIEQALAAAAARHGLSRDDLDDLAVPDFGLHDGCLRRQFGDNIAEVAVAGDDVTVGWMRKDGTPQRSEPTAVRRDFAAERAALKQTVADLRHVLPVQRARLERAALTDRRWTLGEWRERVLDHPLVSLTARRLIWSFELPAGMVAAAWRDGVIVDATDQPVADMPDSTPVRLWHPLDAEQAQVTAWQDWLDRHRVTQPFKQAYREVYLLTDAERATDSYSNRFAAHVIRQHQFKALCDQRGWRYSLQGGFDGHNVPAVEAALE